MSCHFLFATRVSVNWYMPFQAPRHVLQSDIRMCSVLPGSLKVSLWVQLALSSLTMPSSISFVTYGEISKEKIFCNVGD